MSENVLGCLGTTPSARRVMLCRKLAVDVVNPTGWRGKLKSGRFAPAFPEFCQGKCRVRWRVMAGMAKRLPATISCGKLQGHDRSRHTRWFFAT